MRKLFVFLAIVAMHSLSAQLYTEYMPFQEDFDSVLVRAAKSGGKKIEITVTPWQPEQVTPGAGKPGETKWVEVNDKKDSSLKKQTIRWTVLNDSLLRQERENYTGYAIIRTGSLYEYDKQTGKQVLPPGYQKKDSAGFCVRTWQHSAGKFSGTAKTVRDSSGRMVERWFFRPGQPVWYATYQYAGDSVSWMRMYDYYSADSIVLTRESYYRQLMSPDGLHETDSLITQDTYRGSRSTSVITTVYHLDASGRLCAAETIRSDESGIYWKDELTIRYD